MKTMAVSEFKAKALKVLDEVAKSKDPVLLTKRGKPLAQVTAYRQPGKGAMPGKLAESFVFEKDIITPLGKDLWEAAQ